MPAGANLPKMRDNHLPSRADFGKLPVPGFEPWPTAPTKGAKWGKKGAHTTSREPPMTALRTILAFVFALAILMPASTLARRAAAQDQGGFTPMFNGKDLTGWVSVNGAPGTWYVKDDQIVTTGRPTGYLRTDKQYENFIAEFDWMHVPPTPDAVGNSGFFVWCDPIPAVGSGYTRGIEVQVLVNLEWKDKKSGGVTASSHGDLFSIWGAKCMPDRPHPLGWDRCIPSENRAKGANEWNHYRVEANDGVIKLAVNGKVVSGVSKCTPRKGYLALESEGSECRFKNLKIKELPSTQPRPEEVCNVAEGHKPMFSGLDLSGWNANDEAKKHWQPRDTVLHYDGKGGPLSSAKAYGNMEFILDYRFANAKSEPFTVLLRGSKDIKVTLTPTGRATSTTGGAVGSADSLANPPGQWNRLRVRMMGGALQVAVNNTVVGNVSSDGLPATGTLTLSPEGAIDFANLFVRDLK
jgi:hypothetical protein